MKNLVLSVFQGAASKNSEIEKFVENRTDGWDGGTGSLSQLKIDY